MSMTPLSATVSEKGQVTIPKRLRDSLGIRPGEVLEFTEDRGRLVIRKRMERDPADAVWGILKLDRPVDELLDEMRGGVAEP